MIPHPSHRRLGAILTFVAMFLFGAFEAHPEENKAIETPSACVDRIFGKLKDDTPAQDRLWTAVNFCQTLIVSQHESDQQQILADDFVFQRSENIILMWMVVVITIGGVFLAGLQLLASYSLAKAGHEAMGSDTSIGITRSKIAVQSSVVGVIVLAISFAFFLVFVLYVYTFQETKGTLDSQPQQQPHQISAGPLIPLKDAK
jgi:hypothetical protein